MMPEHDKPNDKNGMIRPFAITVGEGKNRPQGMYLRCDATVQAVAEALRTQPQTVERWWSAHLWVKNKRSGDAWIASSGAVVDIDYKIKDEFPRKELVERLYNAAASGEFPGCIFHLTPHGGRLIWVYDVVCNDRELQKKAERGAAVLGAKALEKLDLTEYEIDSSTIGELARFFYTPNSIAKGIKRSAQVFVMREELVKAVDLSTHYVAVRPVETPPAPKGVAPMSSDMVQAIDAWNKDNPGSWPRHSAECPVCGHKGCFGTMPDDPTRWYCWSTDHPTVGLKGEKGYHGDALDLEAHRRGCKPIEVLKKDGYLVKKKATPTPPPQDDGTEPDDTPIGYWRSRSYATAVQIIEQNARNVLENRKLEFNEMSGVIELGRKPIQDADAHRIRYLIERSFSGGVDKKGNQVGMQISAADILAAITQVAYANKFHPVRQYLQGLKWDGRERIKTVLAMLGAEDSPISQIIMRRFFVSAVARPLDPGCKVDTVLILVGKQGVRKSSFFKALSDPWFIDTPINISSDEVRAYMTMRRAWILEWAELEALLRARDITSVKAFISSRRDSYVPKHAKFPVDVDRGGVIVGTTNTSEFLTDETGERRFLPIVVGAINYQWVAANRDQLWAEAVSIYKAAEQCPLCKSQGERCESHRWWLDTGEEQQLAPHHVAHRVGDVWEGLVLKWARDRVAPFTTGDVLQGAIVKEISQWTRADEMRISKILKSNGWERRTNPKLLNQKTWRPVDGFPTRTTSVQPPKTT
jgi:predicted P-loop ATPase